ADRPRIAERLFQQTGGVPLYVESYALDWAAKGTGGEWGAPADTGSTGAATREAETPAPRAGAQEAADAHHGAGGSSRQGDEGVREAVPWLLGEHVGQRLAALPAEAQEVLGCAAVIGRQSPSRLLVGVAKAFGWSEREVLLGLETACQAQLLKDRGADGYQ